MHTDNEHHDEWMILYLHRFDENTGVWIASDPVSLFRESELMTALDEAKAAAPSMNHLLEPVFVAELNEADRRELAGHLIKSDLLTHQMAWGSYSADESESSSLIVTFSLQWQLTPSEECHNSLT